MERNKIGLQILKEIHNLNINYCIARNFNTFPIIGNDLDIFFDCDINFLTEIIKNICNQYEWVYFYNKNFLSGLSTIRLKPIHIFYFLIKKIILITYKLIFFVE